MAVTARLDCGNSRPHLNQRLSRHPVCREPELAQKVGLPVSSLADWHVLWKPVSQHVQQVIPGSLIVIVTIVEEYYVVQHRFTSVYNWDFCSWSYFCLQLRSNTVSRFAQLGDHQWVSFVPSVVITRKHQWTVATMDIDRGSASSPRQVELAVLGTSRFQGGLTSRTKGGDLESKSAPKMDQHGRPFTLGSELYGFMSMFLWCILIW